MERTIEIAIYTALSIAGIGILLGLVWSMRDDIAEAGQRCPEDGFCTQHNGTACDGDLLIKCHLDENGCVTHTAQACPAGCLAAPSGASCK